MGRLILIAQSKWIDFHVVRFNPNSIKQQDTRGIGIDVQ